MPKASFQAREKILISVQRTLVDFLLKCDEKLSKFADLTVYKYP